MGAAAWISSWWWIAGVLFALLGMLGIWDLAQRRHSVLRNYPVIGHARSLMESIRPELQQYFVERNFDGRPLDRDVRSIVYERAKGTDAEEPYGTERDVYRPGHEFLVPSMAPCAVPRTPPRVRIGGPDCTQPYDMALLNVSATRLYRATHDGAAGTLPRDTAVGAFVGRQPASAVTVLPRFFGSRALLPTRYGNPAQRAPPVADLAQWAGWAQVGGGY